MLRVKSVTIQRIKQRLDKFYKILAVEHKCSTSFECQNFITKYLYYYKKPEGWAPKKLLRSILDRCDLKFLGSGASRFVVGIDKFAIKLEKWSDDYCDDDSGSGSSNEDELGAYKEIQQDPLRKLLVVPMVSHFRMNGDLVLVYPRLESYDELFSNPNKSPLLENTYNGIKETACNWMFSDSCSNNLGLYKNELFYLDFNIESDESYDYSHDVDLKKQFDKAIDDFKMMTVEIHRTKQYIQEMRAIV